jgi:hypothetical protein
MINAPISEKIQLYFIRNIISVLEHTLFGKSEVTLVTWSSRWHYCHPPAAYWLIQHARRAAATTLPRG